jgi:hypothetical protein
MTALAAPKGNEFWKVRSTHGRKPIFETPDALWDAASEYFQWAHDNPLWEDRLITYQGEAKHEPIAKMRAMTIAGLCIFLDISQQAFGEYRHREGFGEVTTRIDDTIRSQKFEGAAADLLNANIIARDLGLAERQEHTGADGGPVRTEDVTDTKELARRVALMLTKAEKQE